VIPLPVWIGSFAWLALVTAFVCTAVKEEDDRALVERTLSFVVWMAVGTVGFCGVVLAIERLI
jgi:hypothetical protein